MPLDGFRGNSILFSPGSDSLVIEARRVDGTREDGLWVTSIRQPHLTRLEVENVNKLLQWGGGLIYFQTGRQFLRRLACVWFGMCIPRHPPFGFTRRWTSRVN